MKKYFKILFVSLLVTLTIGKGALASSMVLTPAQHDYYLKNIKGCLTHLMGAYEDNAKLAEWRHAEKNLRGVANDPRTHQVVLEAFDDYEKDSRLYNWGSKRVETLWLDRLSKIREIFLGK
jgi:hypothetical protein